MNLQSFIFIGVIALIAGCVQPQNSIGGLTKTSDDWGQTWNQAMPDCDLSEFGWTLDNSYYPITFGVPAGNPSPNFQLGNGWYSSSFGLYCNLGTKSGENVNYLYCNSSSDVGMKIQKHVPAVVLPDGTIKEQAHTETFEFDKDTTYVVLNPKKIGDGSYSTEIINEFCSNPSKYVQPAPNKLDFSLTECDAQFGPFSVLQRKITANETKLLLGNQTGSNVSFTGATITGTNSGPTPYTSGDISVTFDQGVLILTPATALESGEYNLSYTLTYNAGPLTGLNAVGSCRGTIRSN